MELKQVIKLIADEKRAYRYLRSFRWHGKPSCPRCGSSSLLHLSDKRYECRGCSSRFSDFSGTYLARTKLSPSEIILGVKLFELGLSAREAAKQVEVNYKSMLRLYNTIRQAIVDYSHQTNTAHLSGEIEMDETYFGGKRKGRRGRGADNKIPVFGMMERNGKVVVEPVPNVSAETLTKIIKEHVRPRSRTYTDQYRSYNSLLIKGYEHIRIDHNRHFANGRAYINSIEGFWSYAKERLAKFHGVSPERFYFYIKELEFRFNNRNCSIFNKIIDVITNLLRLSGQSPKFIVAFYHLRLCHNLLHNSRQSLS